MIFTINGQQYEQTGNAWDGKPVVCKLGDFERACRSFTDELLYVVVSSTEVVACDGYKARPSTPTDPPRCPDSSAS